MIKLNQKQEIMIAAFLEGKSQGQIAKDTGIDRKTIRKYVGKYYRNVLIGQTGTNAYNGKFANQSKGVNLSTNSFNISINYGWVPVKITDSMYAVGANSNATLNRGTGSSWTLSLVNNY